MRFTSSTAAILLLLLASTAGAQPFFTIGSGSGNPGAGVTVDFSFSDGGQSLDSFEGTITYDSANLTADLSACGGFTNVVPPDAIPSCSDNGSGVITVIGFSGSGSALTGQSLGSITFTIGAGVMPPMDFSLDVGGEAFAFAGGTVTAGTSTDGTISAADGPGPGVLNVQPATLGLMADVNAAAGTGVITISNDGAMIDATINPSCSLGPITGSASITVTAAPASLAPGASGTVTASCSGATVGQSTATYTCTAGAATVTNGETAITCDIAVGTPNPNPAGGTTTAINVGPVTRGNSGTGALTFTETNNSGGAYDVSCVLTDDGMGAFAITSATTATVNAATPFALTVSGTSTQTDPQPTGVATCTYSAGATGTVTINLGIALVPEIVPTMTEWGLILLTLALVGFGAFQLRRRAPLA
ncbi:MAG: IPTL-CTERM sorting domain-containing protein [Pseudomonadota bacterium]